MDQDQEFQKAIQERFRQLPRVVQEAIVSADVSKHLRELADSHKLHLDQWESLENEVQYTLLGIQHTDKLAENIQKTVGVPADVAQSLAGDISRIVFEPIRQQLERELDHPDAVAATTTGVEDVRAQILAQNKEQPAVVPATPPAAPPAGKVERAPMPASYAAQPSHERAAIEGDPYREQIA